MGKLLYARLIRTYTHLKERLRTSILPVSKGQGQKLKSKLSFISKTCTKCVIEGTLMRLFSPTKLARYTLQANMYYWVLDASMINFKITSTITAI